MWVQSETTGLHVMNNVFSVAPGVSVIDVSPGQRGIQFAGNCYWAGGGELGILWAGIRYRSLEQWRGTGQERGTGIGADPRLPRELETSAVRAGSPLVDAAVNLSVDTGGRDFAGTRLPQGRAADVGAWELVPGTVP
jgi:hypothetical protein